MKLVRAIVHSNNGCEQTDLRRNSADHVVSAEVQVGDTALCVT